MTGPRARQASYLRPQRVPASQHFAPSTTRFSRGHERSDAPLRAFGRRRAFRGGFTAGAPNTTPSFELEPPKTFAVWANSHTPSTSRCDADALKGDPRFDRERLIGARIWGRALGSRTLKSSRRDPEPVPVDPCAWACFRLKLKPAFSRPARGARQFFGWCRLPICRKHFRKNQIPRRAHARLGACRQVDSAPALRADRPSPAK